LAGNHNKHVGQPKVYKGWSATHFLNNIFEKLLHFLNLQELFFHDLNPKLDFDTLASTLHGEKSQRKGDCINVPY